MTKNLPVFFSSRGPNPPLHFPLQLDMCSLRFPMKCACAPVCGSPIARFPSSLVCPSHLLNLPLSFRHKGDLRLWMENNLGDVSLTTKHKRKEQKNLAHRYVPLGCERREAEQRRLFALSRFLTLNSGAFSPSLCDPPEWLIWVRAVSSVCLWAYAWVLFSFCLFSPLKTKHLRRRKNKCLLWEEILTFLFYTGYQTLASTPQHLVLFPCFFFFI